MKRFLLRAAALAVTASPAAAVNVVIDYTYDTGGFFSPQSADGAAARSTVEAAASFFSEVLEDSLSPIETPPPFQSAIFDGQAEWRWSASVNHPSTGALLELPDLTIAADEFRIFVGARGISGSTIGLGGPGGFGWSFTPSGGFTSDEIALLNATNDAFGAAVELRGQPVGEFAAWGGALTFDNNPGTPWHFDHTTDPGPGKNDLFSVALHELAHALGIGLTTPAALVGTEPPTVWETLTSGSAFIGASAIAANGGTPPMLNADRDHWAAGTVSTVYGGFASQEAALDPDLLEGGRKFFTTLDAAALADLGWEVADGSPLPGDYNLDQVVDAADYTVWRDALGTPAPIGSYSGWAANYGASRSPAATTPEPGSIVFGLLAAVLLGVFRGRPGVFC
ncbi:hypothetical protein [Botrimarina sp.]|uniref:hypothetical protein n=1 Tax=Botrimarina sp. TaxID=2795802 RepID=UPI0032EE7354